MERFDIAIIGTGPAGISAAITAKLRKKKIILIGSSISEKVSRAHTIENYPALPHISGSELTKRLMAHLSHMDIEIVQKRVNAIYSMGSYFSIQAGEEFIESRTVIAAGGVVQGKTLPGEKEFLGRGVSYCATCDGFLYKGKTLAVLGYSADSAQEADYLCQLADRVLYFPLSSFPLPRERENLTLVKEHPVKITGSRMADLLHTDKGEYKTDCIFILRDALAPDTLIPGILTDGPHIKVNLQMETNLPGLFACGDIAGKPYQYIKAAGQGNVAALSAVAYLAAHK